MPTMCRSPVHSAANAASLCDTCNSLASANRVGFFQREQVKRLRFWRFEVSLGFGVWILGFPGPCLKPSDRFDFSAALCHQLSTDFRTDRVTACLLHNESDSYCLCPA